MDKHNVFWALVKQDLKVRKRRNSLFSGKWLIAYVVTVAIVAIAAATYAAKQMNIELNYVWYFTFGLPFMVFGTAAGMTSYEWKNNTVGWWLSLPLPRIKLAASKYVAALLRALIVIACIFCAIEILALYTMLLQGGLSAQTALLFTENGLRWLGLLLALCPFFSAFGVLIGILSESKLKPVIPLFWISFFGLWWVIFSHDNRYIKELGDPGKNGAISLSPHLWYPILGSFIVAYLLIHFASYLLDKQSAL